METIFKLAKYDVITLFWMFFILWAVLNYSMYLVEKVVWGEAFTHWGDLVLLGVISIGYGFTAFEMGKKLIVNFISNPS